MRDNRQSIREGEDNTAADFRQAVALHREGQLDKALALYDRILASDPVIVDVLHMLGVLEAQGGRPEHAEALMARAVRLRPEDAVIQYNLARALEGSGQFPESIAAYERAATLNPGNSDALFNLGRLHQKCGRAEHAAVAYGRAVDADPDDPVARYNLAITLEGLGRFHDAVTRYRETLSRDPAHEGAEERLGFALAAAGHPEKAFEAFHAAALRRHGPATPAESGDPTSHAKLVHDREQLQWQIKAGIAPSDAAEMTAGFDSALATIPEGANSAEPVTLEPVLADRLAPFYNKLVTFPDTPRLEGPAINPDLDTQGMEDAYFAGTPEITWFDDLLTADALTALQRFCLGASVWSKIYNHGYLGSMMADGFATPLLLQIAEELRARFPRIFAGHPLRQAWGFKYDQSLPGIDLHADFAAVNVNFWITPDAANLEPDRGGLVVWDKEAPNDWDFERYNRDTGAMREFLAKNNAKAVTVPYRQNRFVVFNSDLFHETDKITFRDGFENRRVNVTLLFGTRKSS